MKVDKRIKNQFKQQKISITREELEKIKMKSTERAVNIIVAFPMMVLRDEFGFGEKRLRQFHKSFMELNDAYNKGYLDVKDIWQTLEKETGIQFTDGEE